MGVIVTVSPIFALVLLRDMLPLTVEALFTLLILAVSTRVTVRSTPVLVPLLLENMFISILFPLVRTGTGITKFLFMTISLDEDVAAPSYIAKPSPVSADFKLPET